MDSISGRRVEPIPRSSLDAMEISSSKVPDEEDEDDDDDERETKATFCRDDEKRWSLSKCNENNNTFRGAFEMTSSSLSSSRVKSGAFRI